MSCNNYLIYKITKLSNNGFMEYIKNFKQYSLNEVGTPQENEQFVKRILTALNSNGFKYEVMSSKRQLNNGTVEISNISINSQCLLNYFNISSDKLLKNIAEPIKIIKDTFIFYQIGSLNKNHQTSTLARFKNDSDEDINNVVLRLLAHYIGFIDLNNIFDINKISPNQSEQMDLDPLFVKNVMYEKSYKLVVELRNNKPNIYRKLSPDILFASYFVLSKGHKLFISTNASDNISEFCMYKDDETDLPFADIHQMITTKRDRTLFAGVSCSFLVTLKPHEIEIQKFLKKPKNWKPVEQLVDDNITVNSLNNLNF